MILSALTGLLCAGSCAPEDGELTSKENIQLSSECKIESIQFASTPVAISNQQIVYILPKAYNGSMSFKCNIEVSEGATVTPADGATVDLSVPVTFTVTAQNGKSATYTASALKAGEGLYVNGNRFYKDGVAFKAMGINYFDLFYRSLKLGWNVDPALDGMQQLSDNGIKLIRFAATPYWPVEFSAYTEHKEDFFAKLDQVVHKAEELGIGLIPSLFWNIVSVPDAMDPKEHMDAFSDLSSKSVAFVREFTQSIVARYKDSPAIYAWEFGNEWALSCDEAGNATPAVQPSLGTAATRDPKRDHMTQSEMQTTFGVFVEEVRKLDATRPIISGNAAPRNQAYHLYVYKSWGADSHTQHKYMLDLNESQFNTVSVHIYYNNQILNIPTMNGYVRLLQRFTTEINKPLFVGEFGASNNWGDASRVRSLFEEYVAAIVENEVPLSCVWNFDRAEEPNDEWSITTTNSRSYMLEMIRQANAKLNE